MIELSVAIGGGVVVGVFGLLYAMDDYVVGKLRVRRRKARAIQSETAFRDLVTYKKNRRVEDRADWGERYLVLCAEQARVRVQARQLAGKRGKEADLRVLQELRDHERRARNASWSRERHYW